MSEAETVCEGQTLIVETGLVDIDSTRVSLIVLGYGD